MVAYSESLIKRTTVKNRTMIGKATPEEASLVEILTETVAMITVVTVVEAEEAGVAVVLIGQTTTMMTSRTITAKAAVDGVVTTIIPRLTAINRTGNRNAGIHPQDVGVAEVVVENQTTRVIRPMMAGTTTRLRQAALIALIRTTNLTQVTGMHHVQRIKTVDQTIVKK